RPGHVVRRGRGRPRRDRPGAAPSGRGRRAPRRRPSSAGGLAVALRVVGAGVGRTGTNSLKVALEQLLGGPCYHMFEVMQHPEHVPLWSQAVRGELGNWDEILGDYVAAVDWPVASFWPELVEANPDALVLLSTRDSADTWWTSAHNTIFTFMTADLPPEMHEWREMVVAMMRTRFTDRLDDEAEAKAAYGRHNEAVRRAVPEERLLEWQ